tara:strand:+ start:2174 stop:2398 length:225 start_codon:yes stop_codon:yes gene_type:complete
MTLLDTIRNIILEDKSIDLDTWRDASYVDQGTDGEDRESLALTPPVLDAIISSPRLLALLADALKPYLDTPPDE